MIPRTRSTNMNTKKSDQQQKRVTFQEDLPSHSSSKKVKRSTRSSSKRSHKKAMILRTPLPSIGESQPSMMPTMNRDHVKHNCSKHAWDTLPCSPSNADMPQRKLSLNAEAVRSITEMVQRDLALEL